MASTPDGPRYVASLQDVKDRQCYKDFYESEKQEETKQQADEAAEKAGRSAIVFDRKMHEIIHRKVIQRADDPVPKAPPPPKPKKGKKVKEEKKKLNNDDFF